MSPRSWMAPALCLALSACAKGEAPQVARHESRLEADVYGWVPVFWTLDNRRALALASLGGTLFLFGGEDQSFMRAHDDLWAWDGQRWEPRSPPVRPAARSGHAMATLGSRIVLFGGRRADWSSSDHGLLNDTWEFDGARWQQKTPATQPSARNGHAMGVLKDKVVLYGGWAGDDGNAQDTWTWDGSDWVRLSPEHYPPALATRGLSFASDGERLFLAAEPGLSTPVESATWFWNGSDWESVEVPAPNGRAVGLEGSAFVVGDETWKWDGGAWIALGPTPDSRWDGGLAVLGDKAVRYGGFKGNGEDGPIRPTTWSFDGSAWRSEAALPAPAPRWLPAIASMGDGSVMLFGGRTDFVPGECLADTWRWNVSGWEELESSLAPSFEYAVMAPLGSKMLLVGETSAWDTETWEWSVTGWRRLAVPTLPGDVESMASSGDRAVVASTENTWEWDGSNWLKKSDSCLSGPLVEFQGRIVSFEKGSVLEWGGFDWQRRPTSGGPGSWSATSPIASLPDRVVTVDVFTDEEPTTWEWDGNAWTENLDAGFAGLQGFMARQGEKLVFYGRGLQYSEQAAVLLYQKLLAHGSACSIDEECLGRNCIDGVCCDTPCRGQCESCSVSGSEGTCLPHAGRPLNGRALCAGEGTVCGASCDGKNRESCTFPAAETECGLGRCVMGTAWAPPVCDGAGACQPPRSSECAPYGCEGEVCASSCATDSDCVSGYRCEAGLCIAKLELGEACGGGDLCRSGFCVHGVCCESHCPGQCEACDVPGALGKCLTIDGPPREDRAACPGGGQCVAGACEGAGAQSGCGCTSSPGGAGGWAGVALGLAFLAAGARLERSRRRPFRA